MNRYIIPILVLLVMALGLLSCSNDGADNWQRGYDLGYAIGVEDGKKQGEADAKTIEAAARDSGYKTGYKEGYEAGSKERQSMPVAPSTPTVATTLYTNPVWGYSIQVVDTWKVDDTDKNNVLIYGGNSPIAPGIIEIFAQSEPVPGFTLESWVDFAVSSQHSKWSTFQELSRSRFMLPNGLPAYSIVNKYTMTGEEPGMCKRVLTVEGGRVYAITAGTSDACWDKYSMQLEQMVSSIRIQKASTPVASATATPKQTLKPTTPILTPTPIPTKEFWKTYFNPVYPYSIEYPNNWVVRDANKTFIQITSPASGWVSIGASKNSGVWSLRDYVAWVIGYKSKNDKDFLLISSKQITYQGQQAWELSYSETLVETTCTIRTVVVSTPSQFYEVSTNVPSTSSKDYSPTFDRVINSFRLNPNPSSTPMTPTNTSTGVTPTITPSPTAKRIMPARTAFIDKQYPVPGFSPLLTSSNWVVSYFETHGQLPAVPNSLLPLFKRVEAGDKLPLSAEIGRPSLQFWNGLMPSERQTMLDIIEWYGMKAEDYLWLIGAVTPGRPSQIQPHWNR